MGAESRSGQLSSHVQCPLVSMCAEEGIEVFLVCARGHPSHRHVPTAFTWVPTQPSSPKVEGQVWHSPSQSAWSGVVGTCANTA